MYTFEEYKQDLINFYYYEYDKDKKEQRAKIIASLGDEYLLNIYNYTFNICQIILEKMSNENKIYQDEIFTSIYISENSKLIYTNLVGGRCPDILYKLSDDTPYFSFLILKKILPEFKIYESEEYYDTYCKEEDTGSEYSYPTLTISSNVQNFNKVYNEFNHSKKRLKML